MILSWLLVIYTLTSSHAAVTTSPTTTTENGEVPLVVPDPSVVRGLKWLWEQREADYGFKEHTANAVIALQLANTTSWYGQENPYSLVTVKQMDIEILLHLFRHHESPPSPSDLAIYSIALSTLCRDPRQFYGHDLIGSLNHHETLLDFETALASLATCTSGTHVKKKQIRPFLVELLEYNREIKIEALSMVLIALHCIVHDHRNRNLHHYFLTPTRKLAGMQKPDGSFGNLKATALAIQALQATDPGGRHWNKTSAISYVKQQQNDNGSFGEDEDIPTTISVLLALGPKGLANIKELNCHPEKQNDWSNTAIVDVPVPLNYTYSRNNQVTSTKKSTEAKTINATESPKTTTADDNMATVSYSLWIGSNISETHTINITTETNNTFYNVMQLAAQEDDHFSFSSTEWPNGHYVHTLAGYKEEPMSYHYWLLYKLPELPKVTSPPQNRFVAPVGVDELLIEDGDHYLFWYKKL